MYLGSLLIKDVGEGIQHELGKSVYETVSSSTLLSKLQACSLAQPLLDLLANLVYLQSKTCMKPWFYYLLTV